MCIRDSYKGGLDSAYSNEASGGTRAASSDGGGDSGDASDPAPAASSGGGGGGGCFISSGCHGAMVFPFTIVAGLIIAALRAWSESFEFD